MSQRIIIKPEAIIAAMKQLENGSFGSIENDAFEIRQETTSPLNGFEIGKDFYHCQECDIAIRRHGEQILEAFPNCCENHRKLLNEKWFKKTDYSYLPDKLANTLAYTYHCITKNIYEFDWFKRITDYIQYTIRSYGQLPADLGPPVGLQQYLEYVQRILVNDLISEKEKRELLQNWLKELSSPPSKQAEAPDLNILATTYRQWLKEFPFEITFLNHLKPHFENKLPIIEKFDEPNIYNNQVSGTLVTTDKLLENLYHTTDTILTEINTLQLYQTGKISEPNQLQLELLLAKRRHQLSVGYSNKSPDEKIKYRRIIKKWLKDEREFMKNLIEISKSFP